jgi:high affinity sulfate transporter 1
MNLAAWVPSIGWLREYRLGVFRADVVAGITLAAYLIPAGMGDASLAGLSPEAGLYACLFSGLVFWVFCSSKQTAITVTSAISILLGTTLGPMAEGDPMRLGALAACTALLVAAYALVAWVLRAGAIVNFISETVLIGFKAGIALYLCSSQLPKLLGFKGAHGSFWERSWHIVTHAHETSLIATGVGGCALLALILGSVFLKNKPVALFVVIGGVLATAVLHLDRAGLPTLGAVPEGLPRVGLPLVSWADLDQLLEVSFACFLLAAVETAAIGRTFAAKHGGRYDANQEFLALAAANVGAGLGQGYAVSGGMSQSLVNDGAGARTPISGLIAAIGIILVVLFLTGPLSMLPQTVLAAIVLMAAIGLIKVKAIKQLWQVDRAEFFIGFAAFLGVLNGGILRGVFIGSLISILWLLHQASRLHVSFLGRIPGSTRYSDLERHPDNEPTPGVLICRPEGSIVYFNAGYVHDRIMYGYGVQATRPGLVLLDLSASPRVDVSGAEMLIRLAKELASAGSRLRIVEARASVRDRLRSMGIEEQIGRIDRFSTVADAIRQVEQPTEMGA